MNLNNEKTIANRVATLCIGSLLLISALTVMMPTATATTGNETIVMSGLTNNSATVTLSNLDANDSYYWSVYVYHSNGTLWDYDYNNISGIGGAGSVSYGSQWLTPTINDTYDVSAVLIDSNLNTLTSQNSSFQFTGGSGAGPTVLSADSYEPNENNMTASSVSFPGSTSGLTIHNSTDDDWFTFNSTGGQIITIEITFTHNNGDLDMDVYRGLGATTFVGAGTSISDDETVTISNSTAGPYFVYVYGYSGADNYYNLSITVANSSGQNDAGSGGDVADNAALAYSLNPGSHSQYTGFVDASTDLYDWYNISVPTGYNISASISFGTSNDFDLYLRDSNNSTNIDYSWYTNPELVESNGTVVGGSNVYVVVSAYTGSGSYTMDLWLFPSGISPTNLSGDLNVVFHNSTDGSYFVSNLTNNSNYDLDAYLLDWDGTNFTQLGNIAWSFTSNSTTHSETVFVTLDEIETTYCLYGELYPASGSTLIDDDIDCIYQEILQTSVTSDTGGTMTTENITSGNSYSYQWYLYINGGPTYVQSGSSSFTASAASETFNIGWTQPNGGQLRCFSGYLYNSTSTLIGQHDDCFYPTWPGTNVTGYTANSNASTNSLYFDAVDLISGTNYNIQAGIMGYSNGTVVQYSSYTGFTSSSTSESFLWNFSTPSVSGYYCGFAALYNSSGGLMGNDSACFMIIHDDDGDGVWNENDLCPNTPANATVDLNGCAATQRDTDNDGVNDAQDAFPFDSSQWQDSDGDGYGDNASGNNSDAFPNDATQWSDQDGDGWGDNQSGTNPDAFPTDPNQHVDSDGDGYGDNSNATGGDLWPTDPSQWWDSDGDGYGDNSSGTNGDAFPSDSTQWSDGDGDGWGDNPSGNNPDAFPQDGTQWSDQDGDGYGDNSNGNNADAFPTDSTQWADQDGDGYGDNPTGNNPDAFPTDGTQWADSDGDGYGDNPSGNNADSFPADSTQWSDRDADGYGDNPQGNNPDLCPDTPSGETVDSTGCSASERDSDGDGVMDSLDDCLFENATGWDDDSDGCIDDSDDDGLNDPDDACMNEDSTGYDTDQDGCIDDSDGDMVKDNVDQCPTTDASGFDSKLDGCIDDTDGDLVPDNVDACRYVDSTGYDNDGDGCIDDTDGDNIKDNIDACPYENATGFDDDQNGCIDDSDQDGVKDNNDLCPNTQDLDSLDSNGCSDFQRDMDADSIKDYYDQCPNTPIGEQVNPAGCSASQRDSDGDYIVDSLDLCPQSGSGLPVNTDGCAQNQLDADGDGIDDSSDQCDNTLANETANNYGCSDTQWDSDSDGVMDANDDCPNEEGTSTIDRIGCLDTDGDGVSDLNDAYPQDASKQTSADVEQEGGISTMVIAVLAMVALFGIVAGAIVVLRMRGGDSEGGQFSGGLTSAPMESLSDMAMAHVAATEYGMEASGQEMEQPVTQGVPSAEPEQWVDENGVTWHRQPDGSLLRWNGESWEPSQ